MQLPLSDKYWKMLTPSRPEWQDWTIASVMPARGTSKQTDPVIPVEEGVGAGVVQVASTNHAKVTGPAEGGLVPLGVQLPGGFVQLPGGIVQLPLSVEFGCVQFAGGVQLPVGVVQLTGIVQFVVVVVVVFASMVVVVVFAAIVVVVVVFV